MADERFNKWVGSGGKASGDAKLGALSKAAGDASRKALNTGAKADHNAAYDAHEKAQKAYFKAGTKEADSGKSSELIAKSYQHDSARMYHAASVDGLGGTTASAHAEHKAAAEKMAAGGDDRPRDDHGRFATK